MYVNDSDEPRGTLAYVDNFPAEAAAELDALRARVAEAEEGWHMANGVADLAMKHRDMAEARVAELSNMLEWILGCAAEERLLTPHETGTARALLSAGGGHDG